MSKKTVLVISLLVMSLVALSVVSARAQVKIHKLGRPWEVDNFATPYFDGSHAAGGTTCVQDGFRKMRETIDSRSGTHASERVMWYPNPADAASPVVKTDPIRRLLTVLFVLQL